MPNRFPKLQAPEPVRTSRAHVLFHSAPLPMGEALIIGSLLLIFILR